MTGQTLSHFQILEKIAEGGMGVVYRALDTRLGRPVAIKVLRPDALGDPERKRRFVQEARTASALNHPNIVTIYDIDRAHDVDFIAMEYVEGQSLDRVAGGRPLPIDQALDFAIQLAAASGAAHAAGVVHRDIKPANIMVGGAGHVKMLDFGLAKVLPARPNEDDTATAYVAYTEEGTLLGTVAYMSPEQAQGKPVNSRSDVFSLGAVLYEMLAGRRPFAGDSSLSTLASILRDAPVPLTNVRPEVPEELARIVARCFEKDRDLRFPSGKELGEALARCRTQLAGAPAGVGARSMRSRAVFALAGAALALATGLAWWVTRGAGADNQQTLSEIAKRIEEERDYEALRIARRAGLHLAEDPQTRQMLRNVSITASIRTEPDGADIYIKDYLALDQEWELLGRAPITNALLPLSQLRWRIVKDGWETSERAGVCDREPSVRPGAAWGGHGRDGARAVGKLQVRQHH